MRLSQDFYSMIPHRLGTTKEEVHKAVISNLQFLEEKQDLLQLMKDIIEVRPSSLTLHVVLLTAHAHTTRADEQHAKQDVGHVGDRPHVQCAPVQHQAAGQVECPVPGDPGPLPPQEDRTVPLAAACRVLRVRWCVCCVCVCV